MAAGRRDIGVWMVEVRTLSSTIMAPCIVAQEIASVRKYSILFESISSNIVDPRCFLAF